MQQSQSFLIAVEVSCSLLMLFPVSQVLDEVVRADRGVCRLFAAGMRQR